MLTSPHRRPAVRTLVSAWAVSAVTVLAAGSLSACRSPASADQGDTDGDEEVATPVVLSRVVVGEIEATIEAASTIEPERTVTVHAESTGRITMLPFEEGDAVDEGKLIAKIKQDAQRSGLDRAATSLAKAKDDLAVVERLHKSGHASDEELRTARLALDTARIDVRDRKRDVSNTRITAPMSGTVTERFVSQGAFVSAGAQLATIVDFSSLVARVYVPERELDRIAVGQTAQVVGKAATGRKGEGTVLRIAPVVDATTGTVKVTVALPAPLSGGATGFLPGMYAEVTLVTQRRTSAVLLDKQTLVYRNEEPFVFVRDGDRVRERPVKIGLSDADHVEVLEGVAVGDEVVRSGQAGLEDGGLIRAVDPSGQPVPEDGERGETVTERATAAGASAGAAGGA